MNPLDQLKDIHLPAEASLWPLAYGWWLLALVVVVVITTTVIAYKRYTAKRAVKKHALVLLSQIQQEHKQWPQQLNSVLKRVAINYFPEQSIATMHSASWSDFLTQQLPVKKQPAFNQVIVQLQESLYQADNQPIPFDKTICQTRIWIESVLPPKPSHSGVKNV